MWVCNLPPQLNSVTIDIIYLFIYLLTECLELKFILTVNKIIHRRIYSIKYYINNKVDLLNFFIWLI